ncbi:MAG: methyl-accepting chemotaxis protein [Spirochaetota bacterium]|nr:methyl-accepting chemotaxis protein [Spirochaetota bacterium]
MKYKLIIYILLIIILIVSAIFIIIYSYIDYTNFYFYPIVIFTLTTSLIILLIQQFKNIKNENINLINEIDLLNKTCTNNENQIIKLKNDLSIKQIENNSNDHSTSIIKEMEYINTSLIIIDCLLNSIPERTLKETENVINTINRVTIENQNGYRMAIDSFKRVISVTDEHDKASFKHVEDSAMKLRDIHMTLDDIVSANKSKDQYIQQVETKIENIKNFTQKIEKISESTHVLSINASIEAARSGTHAKGFAVIASEIKKLAAEAKKSVESIHDITKESYHALNLLKNEHKKIADKLSEQTSISKIELDEIFEVLSHSFTEIAISMSTFSDSSKKSIDSLNNIIYIYSQSQDILTQQINHIQQVLDFLKVSINNLNIDKDLEKSNIDKDKIKLQVVSDIYSNLTMDYERTCLKKAAVDQLKIESTVFDNSLFKDLKIIDKTKEIIGEELSDSIVLF